MIKLRPVDYEAENEGIWVDYYGARLKIASKDTMLYQSELQKALRNANGLDYSDLHSQHGILAGVVSRSLLRDWEVDGDGGSIPYDAAKAEETLLTDYKTFKFIVDFASEEANYKAEQRKKIAKKHQTRSAGISSTAEQKTEKTT